MAHLALWIYVWRRNKRLQITTLEVRGWGRGDGRVLSWVENHLGSPVHHQAITCGAEASAQKKGEWGPWATGHIQQLQTLLTMTNQVRYTLWEQSGLTPHHYFSDFCVKNYTLTALIVWRPNGNKYSVLSQDVIWPSSSTLKQWRGCMSACTLILLC